SSNCSIESIDDKGLVSSSATGQVTISANWGSITQSTLLTVSTVKLVSITVNPANGRVAPHTSALFTAVGNFSDGSTANLKIVSWKSSKPQFASIRSSGLAHGKKAGTVTISATSSGVTGTATLVIGTGTLVSVVVSPVNPVVSLGPTPMVRATAYIAGVTRDAI